MTQSLKLEGKVAIVTGAGGKPSDHGAFGTGKAMAVLFAREGAHVIVVDRHQDRADDTRRLIEEAGGKAAVVIANLATEADCRSVVDQAVTAFGKVDILVNNAAVARLANLLETTEEMLHESLTVNLAIPFLLSKAAIPVMIEGGGGAIVNISSIAALRGAGMASYAAAKAGMIGMTTAVANAYGPDGVRANCIAVGAVDTPLRRASVPGEYRSTPAPLNRDGDAWDIARAALFLASEDSAHITGILLRVDAGATTR